MISSKMLQNAYIKLYEVLREYIWPASVVSEIADFEIAIFRVFPDLTEVRNLYTKLKYSCLRYVDDENLKALFEEFKNILDESDSLYSKINVRVEGEVSK